MKTSNSGTKYDNEKPRMDLIDPDFLLSMGSVLGKGCNTHGENDWQVLPNGKRRYYAAAMRHLMAYKKGEKIDGGDTGTGEHHLVNAATCLMFLVWYDRQEVNFDDGDR